MTLSIPELSLVVLIGTSGSGKSTFARRHFLPTEILSSDTFRGLLADDENDQSVTPQAFEALHFMAAKRLALGRLTVIDATNVQPEARKPLIALAREYHCLPVAIVLDMPEALCQERNRLRPDRDFGAHVVRQQRQQLQRSIRGLEREGFRHVHVFKSPEQLEALSLRREPLWNNRKHESGPFDIIGDVHGCFDELRELLAGLGYRVDLVDGRYRLQHAQGRKAVFVGDLVDRGPDTPAVLHLVMDAVEDGTALCVAGNHDVKLGRKLRGKDVKLTHGLAESVEQLASAPDEFRQRAARFLDDLVSHYVLDGGRLVVAHAGLPASMHGRGSGKVREFALYGETTGEVDEYGLPVRHDWAADYRGKATVVYGHTPVPEAEWVNNTLCLDTGCVFGGKLTALRYPERELFSVAAKQVHYEPIRPLRPPAPSGLSAQQALDDVLDLGDVLGKRLVETRIGRRVSIREENAAAALEVMSRFAIDPKWLIYLPPTMSPCETHAEDDWLEHPAEALAFYRAAGVGEVVCEAKHMGSRTVVVICRDEAAALRRFGLRNEGIGIVYTRTGRRFFNDAALERAFLERLGRAIGASGLWQELDSDWLCLDAELLPWSAKAQDLLRHQYAAVGAASRAALAGVCDLLGRAVGRGLELDGLHERFRERRELAERYVRAYRHYCWPVRGLDDVRLAPFHLLASEGRTHFDRDHVWHMTLFERLARADEAFLLPTPYRVVALGDADSERAAIDWWLELTAAGGEGMVVKPREFIARGARGLLQPAVKCRGREYLRIIYGPEYTLPENLQRLRRRGLAAKRSLALREFSLGVEGLSRFVEREPLRRVHECVFGVLALESEPVDPRL